MTRPRAESAGGHGRSFFEPKPRRFPIRSRVIHPQLRDLLICPAQGRLQSIGALARSIDAHNLDSRSTERVSGLSFAGNCLVSGCGLVAVGGEHSELYLRAADPAKKWALHLNVGKSIVNSATFWKPEGSMTTQFLVCNNDYSISRYTISSLADIQSAAEGSLSVDPEHHRPTPPSHRRFSAPPRPTTSGLTFSSGVSPSISGSTSVGGSEPPLLAKVDQLQLPVPVNHCSVSPSGNHLVAVGDSNEVFLFANGSAPDPSSRSSSSSERPETTAPSWTQIATYRMPDVPSSVGSFHTSWRQRGAGTEFAVASEDGVVAVWDVRGGSTGAAGNGWREGMEPVLTMRTVRKGREGAARNVKYSPAGPNELLAFTEQQRYLHVIDARTLDPSSSQLLTVPHPTFCRPRPSGTSRSNRTAEYVTAPAPPWRGASSWVDVMQRNVARYMTHRAVPLGSEQSAASAEGEGRSEGTTSWERLSEDTTSWERVSHADSAASGVEAEVMDANTEPCPEPEPAEGDDEPADRGVSFRRPVDGRWTRQRMESTTGATGATTTTEDDYESALRSFLRSDLPGSPADPSHLLDLSASLRGSTLLNTFSGADSWEDIIGMAWSPDGERLCAATEDSVVEWRVDGSIRRGFGDKGLL